MTGKKIKQQLSVWMIVLALLSVSGCLFQSDTAGKPGLAGTWQKIQGNDKEIYGTDYKFDDAGFLRITYWSHILWNGQWLDEITSDIIYRYEAHEEYPVMHLVLDSLISSKYLWTDTSFQESDMDYFYEFKDDSLVLGLIDSLQPAYELVPANPPDELGPVVNQWYEAGPGTLVLDINTSADGWFHSDTVKFTLSKPPLLEIRGLAKKPYFAFFYSIGDSLMRMWSGTTFIDRQNSYVMEHHVLGRVK